MGSRLLKNLTLLRVISVRGGESGGGGVDLIVIGELDHDEKPIYDEKYRIVMKEGSRDKLQPNAKYEYLATYKVVDQGPLPPGEGWDPRLDRFVLDNPNPPPPPNMLTKDDVTKIEILAPPPLWRYSDNVGDVTYGRPQRRRQ